MVRALLVRGMLVGALAGLLAFGFARLVGEPQVDRAIAFETQLDLAKGEAPEPILVSRRVQSGLGLFTGIVVYGVAIGGLFALVFAFASGRVGRLDPRSLAGLLALAGFVAIVLVPEFKYPANPPSVGEAETIRWRTGLYFAMLAVSVAAMTGAVAVGRRLVARHGLWTAALSAAAAFIVVIAVAQLLLPDINEVPARFPAVVLWRFRIAALGIQLVMWTSLGLIFGWLTERALRQRFRFSRPALP
jgi:predicted cobalt transporter CbtA